MPYGDFKDLALVWRRFCDEKSKISVLWIYVLSDLNGEKNVGTFY